MINPIRANDRGWACGQGRLACQIGREYGDGGQKLLFPVQRVQIANQVIMTLLVDQLAEEFGEVSLLPAGLKWLEF